MVLLILIFVLGFALPLVLMIYVGGRAKHALHLIALLTVSFMGYLETAEIATEGIAGYFSEGWNWIDSSQVLVYVIYLIMHLLASGEYHTDSF